MKPGTYRPKTGSQEITVAELDGLLIHRTDTADLCFWPFHYGNNQVAFEDDLIDVWTVDIRPMRCLASSTSGRTSWTGRRWSSSPNGGSSPIRPVGEMSKPPV